MNRPSPNLHANGAPSTPNDEHWWPRLVNHINTWWMDRRPTGPALRQALRIPPKPVTASILATLATILTALGIMLWWLIVGIVGLVVGIATGINNSTSASGRHLAASGLTRTITRPVHTYLDQHAAGLPVPAHALWLAWLCTAAGLFVLAVAGSRGARLGWIISGATTAAMVYAGTPHQGRALAAGLAITIWAVLSVLAFNRLFPVSPPILLAIRLPRRPDPEADTDAD